MPAMAALVRQQDLDVEVDFHGFCLQEADDGFVPVGYPEGRVGGELLTAHRGRLDIESAGHTHTAFLTVEIWDGEPPADDRLAWEAQGEAELHSSTGELAVWGVAAGRGVEDVFLDGKEADWAVRVYCAGRAEAERLSHGSVPEGVERYLAQFWPQQV
jgi:hypothetical protein